MASVTDALAAFKLNAIRSEHMPGAAYEEPVQHSDAVGEIQLPVAVEVDSGRASWVISSKKQESENRDRIAEVDISILVEITRQLPATWGGLGSHDVRHHHIAFRKASAFI